MTQFYNKSCNLCSPLATLLFLVFVFGTDHSLHYGYAFSPSIVTKTTTISTTSTSINRNIYKKNPSFIISRKNDLTTMQQAASSSSSLKSPGVDEATLKKVLDVAIESSKKAGDIILGNAGGAEITKSKANSRDLLTLIDPLCEKTIREVVLANFPDHDFLGEEDVPPGKEAAAAAIDAKINSGSDWLWIVDPIDGTTNFVNGMPLCMPSVAAAYKGEVVVGVIFDPHRNELFTAMAGGGAQLNGKPIEVGKQDQVGDAVIAMGSPPGEESMQMSLKGIAALMPKVRTIRMLGSAALMLAWIANGRLTGYWEYDLSSWDIAAGALIVQEAGGKFTSLSGEPFTLRTRKIFASNGKVHEPILEILKEAGVV